ncbi:hypothetical protein [Collinsella vaginalis]|uniref:hypothetical protein n=1 Tax=Collinsella vaginalis TaxID=1870987 RepID=UPI00117C454C|nr:hypothetical protein [Collinsella vaginalis]
MNRELLDSLQIGSKLTCGFIDQISPLLNVIPFTAALLEVFNFNGLICSIAMEQLQGETDAGLNP